MNEATESRPGRARSGRSLLVASGLLVIAGASASFAQEFPNRPLRLLTPYGAGGSYDGLSRVMAETLLPRRVTISAGTESSSRSAFRPCSTSDLPMFSSTSRRSSRLGLLQGSEGMHGIPARLSSSDHGDVC